MAEINTDKSVSVPITVKRGDTLPEITFSFNENGVQADLTGNSFKMYVATKTSKKIVLRFEDGNGLSVSDNVVTLSKTADEMKITPGIYNYDLQRTYSDGTVRTLITGTFTVNDDIT